METPFYLLTRAENACRRGRRAHGAKLLAKALPICQCFDDLYSAAHIAADPEGLGDKQYAAQILAQAEEVIEDEYGWILLAHEARANEFFGGLGKARALCEAGFARAKEAESLVSLARFILKNLEDTSWARVVYAQSVAASEGVRDLVTVADEICEQIGDLAWAREICADAEKRMADEDELHELAEVIATRFSDPEWAKKIRERIEESECAMMLTATAAGLLEDCKEADEGGDVRARARKALLRAADRANDAMEMRYVADEAASGLNDKKFAAELYERALAMTKKISEVVWIGCCVYDLGNGGRTREIFETALALEGYLPDLVGLAETVMDEDGFADRKWAKEIYAQTITRATQAYLYAPERHKRKNTAKRIRKEALLALINVAGSLTDPFLLDALEWGEKVISDAKELASSEEERKWITDMQKMFVKRRERSLIIKAGGIP